MPRRRESSQTRELGSQPANENRVTEEHVGVLSSSFFLRSLFTVEK